MAAPKFAPVPANENVRYYESPEYVPDSWKPDRPAEIDGRQPAGQRLGYQGPDQGYVLVLASRLRDKVCVQPGESVDDALSGSVNIALRRASLFGRAPVIYDVIVALTSWGWLEPDPPADLVATRKALFQGVANTNHHYTEGRTIADMVPESTLRLTPEAAAAAFSKDGGWRELTGAGT